MQIKRHCVFNLLNLAGLPLFSGFGQAAWKCSVDMKQRHAVGTCSIDISMPPARTCSNDKQHGKATWAYSMDKQHIKKQGHATGTLQNGPAA
jgi:hypothetical protein